MKGQYYIYEKIKDKYIVQNIKTLEIELVPEIDIKEGIKYGLVVDKRVDFHSELTRRLVLGLSDKEIIFEGIGYVIEYLEDKGFCITDKDTKENRDVIIYIPKAINVIDYFDNFCFFKCNILLIGSNVTNIDFKGIKCEKLDLSYFLVDKLKSFNNLFYNCQNLLELNLDGWNTKHCTIMSNMFNNCILLSSLDLSSFDTSNVTTMGAMFKNCNSLEKVNLSSFDTSKVISMASMFENCFKLNCIDIANFNTENVVNMEDMFYECCWLEELKHNLNGKSVESMNRMFCNCYNLYELDLSSLVTPNLLSTQEMFCNCKILSKIDISNLITNNVSTMNGMFGECKHIRQLDLSHFNTEDVSDMSYMFMGCHKLVSVNLSSFSSNNLVYAQAMFSSCYELKEINFNRKKFKCKKLVDAKEMFAECHAIKELDISFFELDDITFMDYFLFNSYNLIKVNVGKLSGKGKVELYKAFKNCVELHYLDLSNWSYAEDMEVIEMFRNCENLKSTNNSDYDIVLNSTRECQ